MPLYGGIKLRVEYREQRGLLMMEFSCGVEHREQRCLSMAE